MTTEVKDYGREIQHYQPFFGYWEIDSLIGRGQFGRVYKIIRENLGVTEYSAMKWIPLPTNDSELAWMEQEAEDDVASVSQRLEKCARDMEIEINLLRELRRCPNVVGYEDHIVHKRKDRLGYDIFIKMELLTPLMERLKQPFTVDDVIRLGIDICKGLMECREKNIIHRDIKPDNMFVDAKGRFRLGDFGVARQLDESMCSSIRGTPLYMAPEVYKGEKYDYTADIYSLALVMYTLLNHYRVPYTSTTSRVLSAKEKDQAFSMRMESDRTKRVKMPPPAEGFRQLNRILEKALHYTPAKRYQSAADMCKELKALQKQPHPTVLSFGVGTAERNSKEPPSNPRLKTYHLFPGGKSQKHSQRTDEEDAELAAEAANAEKRKTRKLGFQSAKPAAKEAKRIRKEDPSKSSRKEEVPKPSPSQNASSRGGRSEKSMGASINRSDSYRGKSASGPKKPTAAHRSAGRKRAKKRKTLLLCLLLLLLLLLLIGIAVFFLL